MRSIFTVIAVAAVATGCSSSSSNTNAAAGGEILYVAHEGALVSYDLETGRERPGTVPGVASPVDLQVLANGTVMVNLTGTNEVLAVDGKTMLEKARIPSSTIGGLRPVHSYLSPARSGRQLWVTLNDGQSGKPETNTALFVDVVESSPTYLKAVAEVRLGVGHHKGAFSAKKDRVVFSNIGDCDDVLSVYDYSDLANVRRLATLKAVDLGFDGSSRDKTCDPTYKTGQPPSPHGCATSSASGKTYCNVTAVGRIVAVDVDADPPTFRALETKGSGGGYTKALPGGRLVYSLQESPREGKGGAPCQIGQLVVVDASTDAIVRETPVFYKGGDCRDALAGTDEETANPGHMQIAHDGRTLFVTTAGGFGVGSARVRRAAVFDLADPANPVQLASLPTGTGTSHVADMCNGDGTIYGTANNVDDSVTLVDARERRVLRTITTKPKPLTLGTFGPNGPGHQSGPIE